MQLIGSIAATDPLAPQIILENTIQKSESDRLLSVNARISSRLLALRSRVKVLADKVKHEECD